MNAFKVSLSMLLGKRPPAIQVGAICTDPETGQVLLISSRGTGRWIIPKGWPMEGRSLAGAAAREAWEEAGVVGRIQHSEIGRYQYQKDQDEGFSVPVDVRVFLLPVSKLADKFPERHQRERKWFAPVDASHLVAEPGLAQILRSLPAPMVDNA